jgi:hypothetical protein
LAKLPTVKAICNCGVSGSNSTSRMQFRTHHQFCVSWLYCRLLWIRTEFLKWSGFSIPRLPTFPPKKQRQSVLLTA